jgi:methenyltetrahydrofolate cyclohydrolase
MYDSSTTIRDFLDAAAARQPTPGGGSVSALTGALAASMGEMVLNYSIGKKGQEAHDAALRAALEKMTRARGMQLQLMEEDQIAYEAWSALRKLPADAPERINQSASATMTCITVPEAIAATAVQVLRIVSDTVDSVNVWLLSDYAVCADLSMAAIRGAIHNVRVNLGQLTDPAAAGKIDETISEIFSHGLVMVKDIMPKIARRQKAGK